MNINKFKSGLKKLTVNKRIIIDELTAFADEYSADGAEEIAAAIQEHIDTCPPQHKLFAFYLLDNICKTVGNPYNILLANGLFQLFRSTYVHVDDGTRHMLIELFTTWKQYDDHTTVFNMQVLQKIEKFIQQAQNLRSASPGLEHTSKSDLTPRVLIKNAKELLTLHDQLILQVSNFVKGDYHKFLSEEDFHFIDQFKLIQKELYDLINEILSHIYEDVNLYGGASNNGTERLISTPQFEINAERYKVDIVRNQKDMFKQQQSFTDFLTTCKPRLHKAYILKKEKREKIKYLKKYRFVIEKRPNSRFFSHVLNESEEFIDLIDKFGKVTKFTPEELLFVNEPQLTEIPREEETHDHQINSNFLGFPVDLDTLKKTAAIQDKPQESILGISINLDSLLGSGSDSTKNSNGYTDKSQDLALLQQLPLHQQPMKDLSISSPLPLTSFSTPTIDQPTSEEQLQPVWIPNNTLDNRTHEEESLISGQPTQHDMQLQLSSHDALEITQTQSREQNPDPQPVLSNDRPKSLEDIDGVIIYYPIFGDQPSLVNNGSFKHPRKVFRRLVQTQSIGDLTLKHIPEFYKQYEIDVNLPKFAHPNHFPIIPEFRENERNLDGSSNSNGNEVLQIEYHKDATENEKEKVENTEVVHNRELIKNSEAPQVQPLVSTNESRSTIENSTSSTNEKEVQSITSPVQPANSSVANNGTLEVPQGAAVLPLRKISLNDYNKTKLVQSTSSHSSTSQLSAPPPPPTPPPPHGSPHNESSDPRTENTRSDRSRLTNRLLYSNLAIPSNRARSSLKRKGSSDETPRQTKHVKFTTDS